MLLRRSIPHSEYVLEEYMCKLLDRLERGSASLLFEWNYFEWNKTAKEVDCITKITTSVDLAMSSPCPFFLFKTSMTRRPRRRESSPFVLEGEASRKATAGKEGSRRFRDEAFLFLPFFLLFSVSSFLGAR